jgi:predicted Rossmann fold flavoprotein
MANEITIIGAGPAGMTAALFAARVGKQVTLIESNASVGRKLLVTGAGRANLTNKMVSAERYTCGDQGWMKAVLDQFGHSELIAFLESIGVLTYSTADGWCYPLSESAQTVVDIFSNALDQAGVQVLLDHKTTSVHKSKNGFALTFKTQQPLECEYLIVAAGGAAYPHPRVTGSTLPFS